MGLLDSIKARHAQRAREAADRAEVNARLHPPQADKVASTGRLVDMRQGSRYLGHDYVMTSDQVEPGLLRGHIWVTPRLVTGDEIRWTGKGPDGKGADRIGRVVWSRWLSDTDDMFEMAVRVIGRQEEWTA